MWYLAGVREGCQVWPAGSQGQGSPDVLPQQQQQSLMPATIVSLAHYAPEP